MQKQDTSKGQLAPSARHLAAAADEPIRRQAGQRSVRNYAFDVPNNGYPFLGFECMFSLEDFPRCFNGVKKMTSLFRQLWLQEEAQDIAEYAVMLAVILVIVVGTIQLIGSNANKVFPV